MEFRDFATRAGAVAIFGLALYLIFFSNSISGAFIPTEWANIVLDIIYFIGAVFIFNKWRKYIYQKKPSGGFKIDVTLLLIFIPFFIFAVWYIAWGADIIPDTTPWGIGFLDDAAVLLLAIAAASRIRQKLWPRSR